MLLEEKKKFHEKCIETWSTFALQNESFIISFVLAISLLTTEEGALYLSFSSRSEAHSSDCSWGQWLGLCTRFLVPDLMEGQIITLCLWAQLVKWKLISPGDTTGKQASSLQLATGLLKGKTDFVLLLQTLKYSVYNSKLIIFLSSLTPE